MIVILLLLILPPVLVIAVTIIEYWTPTISSFNKMLVFVLFLYSVDVRS